MKRLVAALLLLVLLPTLFYSVIEFSSLTESEELIGQVYRQQLDVVLFSLNQYAWDVAGSWAGEITGILQTFPRGTSDAARQQLIEFMSLNRGMTAVHVTNAERTTVLISVNAPADEGRSPLPASAFERMFRRETERLERLSLLGETGYRKLEEVSMADERGDTLMTLLFIASVSPSYRPAVAIGVDAEEFIRYVLAPKMSEAAGEEFVLSVSHARNPGPVASTDPTEATEMRESSSLWLFPDYTIGIRLKGETIDELVRSRMERNLLLIGLVDLLLIAGAWFVYRTVRREMELARLKADFVSNVSHELRTPLSLIRMFAETLQMGRATSKEKTQEYVDTIVQESERLTRLVNNILSFSRMEAGKKEYQFADADLNDVTRTVLASYETHLTQLGCILVTELAESLPSVSIDREAVSEAILNIIDNAVKYSEKERWVRVATALRGNRVLLEVEDRGIGIAPQNQKRIFEKFFRASDSLVHNTKGSGLGLTLVSHIMSAHGGGVSVRSEPGAGSTFTLWFPLRGQ